MEEDEIGIFSKAPDWKPLFLLNIKIKRNPGCPNKEYSSIFEKIHHNIRIPEITISTLINDYENIIAYSDKSKQSKV